MAAEEELASNSRARSAKLRPWRGSDGPPQVESEGIALGAAFFAASAAVLTFYVWYQTESVKLGLDIAKLDDRIRELEKDIEALKLRKASSSIPAGSRGSPGRSSASSIRGRRVVYERPGTSR